MENIQNAQTSLQQGRPSGSAVGPIPKPKTNMGFVHCSQGKAKQALRKTRLNFLHLHLQVRVKLTGSREAGEREGHNRGRAIIERVEYLVS
jgi:hypothetical protein